MEQHNLIVLGKGIKLCYIKQQQPKPVKKVASLQIINNNNKNNNSETVEINKKEEEEKTIKTTINIINNNIINEKEKNLCDTETEKNNKKIINNNSTTKTITKVQQQEKEERKQIEEKQVENQEKQQKEENKQKLMLQKQQKHLKEEEKQKHLEEEKQQQNKQMSIQQKHLKEEEKQQQENEKQNREEKQQKQLKLKQEKQQMHRRFSLIEALNNGTIDIDIPNVIKYSNYLLPSEQQQKKKSLSPSPPPLWNEKMFFPSCVSSSSNNKNLKNSQEFITTKTTNCCLKPGKFPVHQQTDDDDVHVSSSSSFFSTCSTNIHNNLSKQQKQQQRSRSQPGITLLTTTTNNNNNNNKFNNNNNKDDLLIDFIEADYYCYDNNEIINNHLLINLEEDKDNEEEKKRKNLNIINNKLPQNNNFNNNNLNQNNIDKKGGKNEEEEEKDKVNNKKIISSNVKEVASCCSNDSGVRSSTHSTGSLTTNNSSGSSSSGCCCNNNIENNNVILPHILHLIANSKENSGGVLFMAEAVFENIAMLRDELPFQPGNEVAVLDCSSDELWYGICGPRSGWFPAAYIRPKNHDLCHLFSSSSSNGENCLINCNNSLSSSFEFPSIEMRKLRRRIIQELINTEREYVKLLEHLVKGFLEQCRRRNELFPEERIQRIFGNLELIYALHTCIFKELNNVLNEDFFENTCLANVFLRNSQQFGIYTDYCNNRTLSCTELVQLEKQSQYFHFFEACRLLCALPKLSLDAFLLTPVQRICRYPLQLLELVKATPLNHPDRLALEIAQQTMKQIASKVNDGKKRVDAIQKIWLWQQNVHGFRGPNLIESNFCLLINGELQCRALWHGQLQWSKTGNNGGLLVYLFDQTIVLCRRDVLRRNHLVFKERMGMAGTTLYDLNDGKDPLTGSTLKNSFKLSGCSSAREYIFSCPDVATKNLWLEAIRNRPKKPQPPSQAERRLAIIMCCS